MRRLYRRFLAYFRLDLAVVCEESVGKREYHSYADCCSEPWPYVVHFCRRCKKPFRS